MNSCLIPIILVLACESDVTDNVEKPLTTTKRTRFTRRSTTSASLSTTSPEETTTADKVSTENLSSILKTIKKLTQPTDEMPTNETLESIESSVVTGSPPSPSIMVEIASKKTLRVRNCGERIGDDIPFIAVLIHTNPYENTKHRSLSKGVLISERFVMATVSSIYHSEPFWTVSSVRLGDFVTWNKYANRDKSQSVEVEVDEIFYHKKKDLALIKLKENVNFTEVIRPACLPLSDSYNFKELQSHLCKRSYAKAPADVTLEFAVILCRYFGHYKHFMVSSCRLHSRRLTVGNSSLAST